MSSAVAEDRSAATAKVFSTVRAMVDHPNHRRRSRGVLHTEIGRRNSPTFELVGKIRIAFLLNQGGPGVPNQGGLLCGV